MKSLPHILPFLFLQTLFIPSTRAQNDNWYLCQFMPWICAEIITSSPSETPTETISPSSYPSNIGTASPSSSHAPTTNPTNTPTGSPTPAPSPEPTTPPTDAPTGDPTEAPTYPLRPNLIMILTDQQSVRTLGCYRELFKKENQTEQAHVWGDGIEVETPNIDKLAAEGTLFSNFHTVAPLCTPSRASFMSGLYPQKTGDTGENHGEMDDHITTFAKILRMEKNYYTGYFGKWHLNGLKKPGWGNNKRKFGFEDTKYLWNRGHWKFLDEVNGMMKEYKLDDKHLFDGKEDKHYTTDYLFDRGIEFIEKAKERDQPYAMVLSVPDPHSPNENRQPYQDMYTHLNFKLPRSTVTAVMKNPAIPAWNYHDHENVTLAQAENYLAGFEEGYYFQNYMQQYFGMVKCIDDNVGKLMNYLESSQKSLSKDTIIVFTSDHGNMLGEHGKMNKGRPYRGSAAVPFIIRYPGRVPEGKVVKTARASIDFAPSILSLMDATDGSRQFDGKDFTKELLNTNNVTNWGETIFSFDTGKSPVWVAAIKRGHKLVMSSVGSPWLFDLKRDPFEINNYFDDPNYTEVRTELLDKLFVEMHEHDIPLRNHTRWIFWSTPLCMDSNDRIKIAATKYITCADLDNSSDKCAKQRFKDLCPQTCGTCCKNTLNKPMWVDGVLRYCSDLKPLCNKSKVQQFCPVTCAKFTGCGRTPETTEEEIEETSEETN